MYVKCTLLKAYLGSTNATNYVIYNISSLCGKFLCWISNNYIYVLYLHNNKRTHCMCAADTNTIHMQWH